MNYTVDSRRGVVINTPYVRAASLTKVYIPVDYGETFAYHYLITIYEVAVTTEILFLTQTIYNLDCGMGASSSIMKVINC